MFYSILSFLAALQVFFLPGFIIFSFLKSKTSNIENEKSLYNLIEKIIFSFSISLLFNYLFVFFLVTIGLYSNKVLYCLFIVEVFLLLKIFISFKKYRNFLILSVVFFSITILAIMMVLFFTKQNIFFAEDALMSWNHWALQWFQGNTPVYSRHYPQLIPVMFSIFYKFTNNSILHYAAKVLMPFFFIVMILLKINLFLRFKKVYYLLSVLLISFFLLSYYGIGLIFMGTVDVACCFFYFLFTYLLIIFYHEKEHTKIKLYFYLATISVCTAIIVKQGNVLLIVPYLIFFISLKKISFTKVFLTLGIGLLIIVLPWYFIAEWNVMIGLNTYDRAESWFKLEKPFYYEGRSYFENFIVSLKMIKNNVFFNNIFFTFISIIALLVAIFYKKLNRFFFLAMILPFSILWALFVSYEIRNYIHIVAVLYLVISSGIGMIVIKILPDSFFANFKKKITCLSFINLNFIFSKKKVLYSICLPSIIFVIFILNFTILTEAKIFEKQKISLLHKVGRGSWTSSNKASEIVYKTFSNGKGKILTNQPLLVYNPIFTTNENYEINPFLKLKNKSSKKKSDYIPWDYTTWQKLSQNMIKYLKENSHEYIVLMHYTKEAHYHETLMEQIKKDKIKILHYIEEEKFIICQKK